jgi:hypothetical protein
VECCTTAHVGRRIILAADCALALGHRILSLLKLGSAGISLSQFLIQETLFHLSYFPVALYRGGRTEGRLALVELRDGPDFLWATEGALNVKGVYAMFSPTKLDSLNSPLSDSGRNEI